MLTAKVKFKRLNDRSIAPLKAGTQEAGIDFFSDFAFTIPARSQQVITTGVSTELPEGYWLQLKDRSSLALKGLHVLAGVVDSTYRGEIKVVMVNLGEFDVKIDAGQKVCQGVVTPMPLVVLDEVKELSESYRGDKGFGQLSGK